MSSQQPLLSVRQLCVDYITESGDVRAVNSVSFDIAPGEVFGLAGESGCGKSTVAFSVARLHKPPAYISGGEILFKGENILHYGDERLRSYRWQQVSVVFQSAMNALNPVLRMEEQFCDVLLAHNPGMTRYEAIKRAVYRALGRPDPGHVDTARMLPVSYLVGGFLAVAGIVLVLADVISPVKIF